MRPPPNKRISSRSQRKQQHLLDVKIRVGKERERRVRTVIKFLCWTIFWGALTVGGWMGVKEGWRRLVWENPDCLVHEPEVRTDGTLTREQILATADIVEGRNILTVDLDASRAALEKLPQIESAEVQRSFFPSRVTVSITERRPIAWLTLKKDEDPATSPRAFLIDERGIVLRSKVLASEYFLLPVISGVETENLVPGQHANTFDVRAALELVRTNAENTRFQVRNIDLSKGHGLEVTDQRRRQVTFGFGKIDAQLARLNRLLDVIEPTHQEIRTINLIPERNVPVTFAKPEPETPAPPVEPPPMKPEGKDTRGKKSTPPPLSPRADTKRHPPAAAKPAATTPKPREDTVSPDGTQPPPSPLKKRFQLNG